MNPPNLPPELVYLQWLIVECGYLHPKPIPGGRWAAIIPKNFTHAIATGRMFDYCSIDEHWCYPTRADAKAALDSWTGHGEPAGWIRHPASGRRVAREPGHYDDEGRIVPVGEVYVRR